MIFFNEAMISKYEDVMAFLKENMTKDCLQYKNEVFRNPRCNSLNERGLFPEQFGTNFIAIGQKLSLRQPKTCREGGSLAAAGNQA